MIAHTARQNLVKIADAYGKATGLSRSGVSKAFYGRGSFLDDFRKGRQSISLDKLDSILAEFERRWPPDAEWPFLPAIRMMRGG